MEMVALVPNFEVHNQAGQNYYYSFQTELKICSKAGKGTSTSTFKFS